MSFKNCCSSPRKEPYSLYHTVLTDIERKAALDLLLYLPEIDSFQSKRGTPLQNVIYESYFVSEIKRILHLSDDDFEINTTSVTRTIDPTIAHFYEGDICVNCSKINIAICKGKNKVISLFTRFRDMIAHGYFNFVDDLFIGFDHPRFGSVEYSGIIKIKIDDIKELVESFNSMVTTAGLFRYILLQHGYAIYDSPANEADILIEKDNRKYYLEFKKFSGRYIDQNDLISYLNERQYIDKTDCMFVLIVDSTYTNSKINSILLDYNVCILDKNWIKEMMNGTDIFLDITETVNKAQTLMRADKK